MSTDSPILSVAIDELQKTKKLADKSIEQLSDEQLHATIDPDSNSVAVIMRHMAGNMRSRWTDFLASDGEKPDRMRDGDLAQCVSLGGWIRGTASVGSVVTSSRLYSRSSRSWTMSMWSKPRKPQRKPKPSAADDSIS